MSFSALEKIKAGLFKKTPPKNLVYRDLPSSLNHQRDAKERISKEGGIASPLQKALEKRFPAHADLIKGMVQSLQEFAATAATSQPGYLQFRNLYFQTTGISNDQITTELAKIFPSPAVPKVIHSALGEFSPADVLSIVTELRDKGVYRVNGRLRTDLLKTLRRGLEREAEKNNGAGYRRENEARTWYREATLLACLELGQLAVDPLFYHVASQYLGVEPVLSYITAWISKPHPNDAATLSQSAQLFHTDMSNPSFLKVFIYLNDVGEKNGPHCLVPGTHKNKATELWRDGRINDEEMATYYPKSTWDYQVGEAGSVFFVDTKAFHKGVPLIEGERHLAQFYYVDTLFGEHAPLSPESPAFDPSRFGASIQDYSPRFLSRYALASK
jgi:Phytanoyl-CoA dioxygenase (PhyH)